MSENIQNNQNFAPKKQNGLGIAGMVMGIEPTKLKSIHPINSTFLFFCDKYHDNFLKLFVLEVLYILLKGFTRHFFGHSTKRLLKAA